MKRETVGKTIGGAGAAAGGIGLSETVGLDRAAAVAGDVLRGIFGGLPWEMFSDAVGTIVPTLLEVGMLL